MFLRLYNMVLFSVAVMLTFISAALGHAPITKPQAATFIVCVFQI